MADRGTKFIKSYPAQKDQHHQGANPQLRDLALASKDGATAICKAVRSIIYRIATYKIQIIELFTMLIISQASSLLDN